MLHAKINFTENQCQLSQVSDWVPPGKTNNLPAKEKMMTLWIFAASHHLGQQGGLSLTRDHHLRQVREKPYSVQHKTVTFK